MKDYILGLEKLMSKNMANRGMEKIKLSGELEIIANNLNFSSNIMLVTGFIIKTSRIGETDGPLGTLALCYVLEKLGKKVTLVTDIYSEKIMLAGMKFLNIKAAIEIFTDETASVLGNSLIKKHGIDYLMAIERPGRGKDGRSYSMRGEDITEFCPNTDILFVNAKKMGIKTSAVGDGGNEIGMGKVRDLVIRYVNRGELICADFETDNLITAGVSNWGGYAVCAVLSMINDNELLYDCSTERKLLQTIVKAGAVDGISKKREATVDGVCQVEYLNVFNEMKKLTEEYINETVMVK